MYFISLVKKKPSRTFIYHIYSLSEIRFVIENQFPTVFIIYKWILLCEKCLKCKFKSVISLDRALLKPLRVSQNKILNIVYFLTNQIRSPKTRFIISHNLFYQNRNKN